jgi:hypothetical protein
MIPLLSVVKAYAILIGVAATLCILTGCNPASLGITWPSQKDWHHEASALVDKIEANGHLDRQEVEKSFGKPDAVVPGDAFITGHEELDKYRAYKLHLRGWTDGGDPSRLHDEQWTTSTILIYDEKVRYPWPIAGDWRAYLFQQRDGRIVAGWDTYPGWTPWKDDYWDDVRERMADGGE